MIQAPSVTGGEMPLYIDALRRLAVGYDHFILDIWGVLHDGIDVFPFVPPALRALADAGKTIWLLSNSPRRAVDVADQLAGMGIDKALYNGIITSGEATHQALREEIPLRWGRRCYAVGVTPDAGIFAGTPIACVDTLEQADFILVTSVHEKTIAANMPWLKQAAARNLPFVCANPDRHVHVGDALWLCPGSLAEAYEELGGQVVWFGKPHAAVYEKMRAIMPPGRILAIGDGMPTDIAGANAAEVDAALVVSGIHRDQLFPEGGGFSGPPEPNRLQRFLAAATAKPSFIINGLMW